MPAAIEDARPLVGEEEVRNEVRRFYDSVGWQRVGPGVFQNARYEDLRPVSQEYIRRCRRRVLRHVPPRGRYLLDAGSGPIQYPEYLEYSSGYRYRVCLDLSARALREARERIGPHGLYIVGDLARLPLAASAIDGAVSLHTVHHLPVSAQPQAFDELTRVLVPGATAVVVYGWGPSATIETWTRLPIRFISMVARTYRRWRGVGGKGQPAPGEPRTGESERTHTFKHGYTWLMENTRHLPSVDILVWRTVGTRFLRAFIHDRLLGRQWLRLLYWMEERAPRWFGRHGQYPMIIVRKLPGGVHVRREE
jgi:SAM-dependent methyltransferase